MSQRTDVVYQYDGSFDGLLCCVFRAVYEKETPIAIFPEDCAQSTLLYTETVITDEKKARRVMASIPKKLGAEAFHCVKLAFLSAMEEKECAILAFLRLGYRVGPGIMQRLTDPCVYPVITAAKSVAGEAHLLKGFTRFSQVGPVLVAEIAPKHDVLPLLEQHFRARMPEERFLIYDRTHRVALVYSGGRSDLIPTDGLDLPVAAPQEQMYRVLWTRFYDTVGIAARANPKCRMSHMPKRYWGTMTEFQPGNRPFALAEAASGNREA